MTGQPAQDDGQLGQRCPGAHATWPGQVPARRWLQVVRGGLEEFNNDHMTLIAAGVAFYAFLSLVPAVIAVILLYGLVTDPAEVSGQVNALSKVLPQSARSLVSDQMSSLVSSNQKGLGAGLVVSVLASLWSASGGVGNLVTAVNTAYDEQETRGWIQRKALALGLTLGAIMVFVLSTSLVAVFPAVAKALHVPGPLGPLLNILRWVVVLIVVVVSLAILYRVAPSRENVRLKWVSIGAASATTLWIVASIGFSAYINNFSSYGKTYGSLAGVVVLLLWLWLSVCAILLGAEINAESEQQTAKDTTTGAPLPTDGRGTVKAD
jgi:membrane protein